MTLQDIIDNYNNQMNLFENLAQESENYGGYLRGKKGYYLEDMIKHIVQICCDELNINDIVIDSKKEKIYDDLNNYYNFSIDIQVKYQNNILVSIESKNYCDISMFKRVICDSLIAQEFQHVNKTYLFQLEDCMNNNGVGTNIEYSPTVKFLLNFFHNDKLKILTLLEGQRKSTKPINKKEFHKELKYLSLYEIKEELKSAIKEEYDRII